MIVIIGGIIISVAIVAFMFNIKTKIDLNKSKERLLKTTSILKNNFKQAECGTSIIEVPSTIKVPDGYELPKFNSKTGHAEYSDGTIAEHLELRKIQ